MQLNNTRGTSFFISLIKWILNCTRSYRWRRLRALYLNSALVWRKARGLWKYNELVLTNHGARISLYILKCMITSMLLLFHAKTWRQEKVKIAKKLKKPNGIETVKEKHHTGQKDIGLQEYENQEKICKVYKIKLKTFSARTFQPPIQLRWVILLRNVHWIKIPPRARLLILFYDFVCGEAPCEENYFPAQASRDFAVHRLCAHRTVTRAS